MANTPNVEGQRQDLENVAAGTGRSFMSFYIQLAQIVNSTDLITAYPLNFKGRILAMNFVTQSKVTTSGKAATLTPKLKSGTTTTTVTGGVVSLTSALATPEGTPILGTAITALNRFNAGDSLTISATAVTAFSEGTGYLIVEFANDDTLGAIARANTMFNPWP